MEHLEISDVGKTSLRIQCSIPFYSLMMAEACVEAFKKAIAEDHDHFYTVNSISEPLAVKESYEFIVEVAPLSDAKALFTLFRIFFEKIRKNDFRRDSMPLILISSPLFFSNACIPHHDKIPIQSVYFGNIINSGTVGVHWTFEFYKAELGRSRLTQKMKASFEHDRRVVSVQFEAPEIWNRKKQTVEYTIKFYHGNIRRIIVDVSKVMDKERQEEIELYRFHFELNCPAELRTFIITDRKKERYGDGNRMQFIRIGPMVEGSTDKIPYPTTEALAESSLVTLEFSPFNGHFQKETLFELMSRLRIRAGIPIEFASMDLLHMHIGINSPYVKDPLTGKAYADRIEWAAPSKQQEKSDNKNEEVMNNVTPDQFALRYILEALLSRGSKVKDQLLVNAHLWTTFLNVVCKQYRSDPKKTLAVMEIVLNRIDEMTFPPRSIFQILLEELKSFDNVKFLQDSQMGSIARDSNMQKEGYVKVRKVVITPTRKVYIAPEQIMGNRILRKYCKTETEILRVTFRDEDNQTMKKATTGEKLMKDVVENALKDGIEVGGRNFRYLGSSNSQLRDHGCYFAYDRRDTYLKLPDGKRGLWRASKRIKSIRADMGRLDELKYVAKFVARMGQCFTQSRAINTGLPIKTSNFTHDITGGNSAESETDPLEMYTFSDGVGQISLEYMKMITTDLKLPNHPSVIQFRHRGFKGVLSLHPHLDDINDLRKKLRLVIAETRTERNGAVVVTYKAGLDKNGKALKDENLDEFMNLYCRFRDSQMKFHAPRETAFEVVKISGPTPVCLNKPFINILDQVSEMQSRDTHIRLCDRVEELLHRQLRMMGETLVQEKSCRDKLKELPRRVSIDGLSRENGFALTTEPYFRSLLKAAVRFMIKKQLNKEQIPIPLDKGRSMFGVIDETGLLQYGQIFVQYHVNCSDKTPKPSASKIIRRGPTLITKNPCISAGDVRMFEAVDVPALHHLVDVVVFPMHGPRPHPDEMAGSDLDGDEYSVIWDEKLFFDRNEKAMKFPKGVSKARALNMEELDKDIREFFINYITQDSVGRIANAHLSNSDQWGLNSEVAQSLAYKSSQAVDFPKTSVPPEELTKGWEETRVDASGAPIPPELADRKPDFMQSYRDPVYASSRLIGRLFREISEVDSALALSEEKDQQDPIVLDEMIDEEGWEKFIKEAMEQMTVYNNEIKVLMERHGIQSEGELMSGYMISIRNAISDREADDMSFYTTNQVIETQVTQIVKVHRENFIKKFGELKKITAVADDRKNVPEETENVFEREVKNPSIEMRQLAVALYKVTYQNASKHDSVPRLLSFPWIAYDVLSIVRGDNNRKKKEFIAGLDAVNEMLTAQIRDFARSNELKFQAKVESWTGEDKRGDGVEAIKRYLDYYDGLAELAFFFTQWTEREKILMKHFREIHIVLLLIQFCLGHYDEMEKTFTEIKIGTAPLSPRVSITNIGQIVLHFYRWLSSRSFKRIRCVTFDKPDLGVAGCFLRGEWMPMHLAAVRAFYDLIFSLRLDLPTEGQRIIDPPSIIREMNPFVFELPKDRTRMNYEVEEMIRVQTGASEVQLRQMIGDKIPADRLIVSARGTLLSHHKIRQLLVVPLNIKTAQNPKEMSDDFPRFILERIVNGARAANMKV